MKVKQLAVFQMIVTMDQCYIGLVEPIDKYQGQTDGEHFYKTKFGRGEMPKYENKVPDTEIWNIVNYMRTFKK